MLAAPASRRPRPARTWALGLALLALVPACSARRIVADRLGDAIAAGGETFASDDDPELVAAAVPFSLKLMESLLAENPRHRGLLLASARGFAQYAYAFVEQDADEIEEEDLEAALALRRRSRRLYLRARDYGLRGLEVSHRGFGEALCADPRGAVRAARRRDVALLYWTAAAWVSAVSVSKGDADLIADLPRVEALIDRALELDEGYGHGAIHAFLVAYEMSRPAGEGDPEGRAREHFRRSVALSEGRLAGPYVALAEAVALPRQDKAEFRLLLESALAVDPDAAPPWRLANLVTQRRARWLLGRLDQLFVE